MFTKVIGKTNEPDDSGHAIYTPGPQQRPPAPAPAATSAPISPSPAIASGVRNILSSDVEITGSVIFTNDLLVDGRIDGEIASEGNLTVGENAKLKAEIMTGSIVVHGKGHGNITVTDRAELRAGSEVVGDIKAQILTVEAGAVFVGKSEVGTPSTISAGQASKPAAQKQAETRPAAAKPDQQSNQPKQGDPAKQGTLAGT